MFNSYEYFAIYFSVLMLLISNLYQWIILARIAKRIKCIESRIERNEMHHWSLVAQITKAKKEDPHNGL